LQIADDWGLTQHRPNQSVHIVICNGGIRKYKRSAQRKNGLHLILRN
jgi:hypothetical protein